MIWLCVKACVCVVISNLIWIGFKSIKKSNQLDFITSVCVCVCHNALDFFSFFPEYLLFFKNDFITKKRIIIGNRCGFFFLVKKWKIFQQNITFKHMLFVVFVENKKK